MIIARATVDDIETITAHRRAIFFETGYHDEQLLDAMCDAFRAWVWSRIANEKYLGWFVLDQHGDVAAGLGLWLMDWPPHVIGPGSPRGDILNVYTRPESRRQGLARALMAEALEWCRVNGIIRVRLNATTDAEPLYQSFGFTPTHEMQLQI
jgi:GNAT superfamily N-acetyltransferase